LKTWRKNIKKLISNCS